MGDSQTRDVAARLHSASIRLLRTLRRERLASPRAPLGRAVGRVGELALGSPYRANTLEEYLAAAGASPWR